MSQDFDHLIEQLVESTGVFVICPGETAVPFTLEESQLQREE